MRNSVRNGACNGYWPAPETRTQGVIVRSRGCVDMRVLAATTSAVIMQICSFLMLARWCGIYAAMTCRKVAKIPVL